MSCCPKGSLGHLAPSESYVQKGTVVRFQDLDLYVVGSGETAVIVVYDIFGFNGGRVRQVCDSLAEQGHTVVLPDFYRGEAWDPANFPPPSFPDLIAWIQRVGGWDAVTKPDVVERVVPFLRNEKKITGKIGIIGFCWGASVAVASSQFEGLVHAVAGIHPSFVDEKLVSEATCPQLFCPAGNDAPTDPLKAVLDQKPFGDRCVYHPFPDMLHGWSVRGDLNDPTVARDVALVFDLVFSFFDKELKN
eukprot:TRINITY_DN776_c0_g1_i2.p2 TRINITY_DN776_c0_g1~~TRINITY_DN776_c0_g1_i2.p2  ORF type:complete len:260 (-),score=109.90 TRINITY_DN776_c0_g1_i2:39-779(-)